MKRTLIASALVAAIAAPAFANSQLEDLLDVAPGTYTETVTMERYVDIEGAGEGGPRLPGCSGVSAP